MRLTAVLPPRISLANVCQSGVADALLGRCFPVAPYDDVVRLNLTDCPFVEQYCIKGSIGKLLVDIQQRRSDSR